LLPYPASATTDWRGSRRTIPQLHARTGGTTNSCIWRLPDPDIGLLLRESLQGRNCVDVTCCRQRCVCIMHLQGLAAMGTLANIGVQSLVVSWTSSQQSLHTRSNTCALIIVTNKAELMQPRNSLLRTPLTTAVHVSLLCNCMCNHPRRLQVNPWLGCYITACYITAISCKTCFDSLYHIEAVSGKS
jgi:hypothetical protein